MCLAVIEKHPAERLNGLGLQWTGGPVTLGNRFAEIGIYALYGTHAA